MVKCSSEKPPTAARECVAVRILEEEVLVQAWEEPGQEAKAAGEGSQELLLGGLWC